MNSSVIVLAMLKNCSTIKEKKEINRTWNDMDESNQIDDDEEVHIPKKQKLK